MMFKKKHWDLPLTRLTTCANIKLDFQQKNKTNGFENCSCKASAEEKVQNDVPIRHLQKSSNGTIVYIKEQNLTSYEVSTVL